MNFLTEFFNDGRLHIVTAVYNNNVTLPRGRIEPLGAGTATTLGVLIESVHISETRLREVVDINAI